MIVISFFLLGKSFSSEYGPSLEGHEIEKEKSTSILELILTGASERIKFEAGEEDEINLGGDTIIYPYYAKLRYLLDPQDNYTPYYLVSLGINYVDGEELIFSKFVNDLTERMNYGIGVGIEFKESEIEILYGKYNYQVVGVAKIESENMYSSTRLTLKYKYKF
jgi:hypothetical protein